MRHRIVLILTFLVVACGLATAQQNIAGALPSYNDEVRGTQRKQQYFPVKNAFVCENGNNRFTRALYGGYTDYRIETSDRPVFAVVKKGHHKNIRIEVDGLPLDSATYCKATYENGMRSYVLKDKRWTRFRGGPLRIHVVALPYEEGGIWEFIADFATQPLDVKFKMCDIAEPKLKRNGDLGADKPGVFEPDPTEKNLVVSTATHSSNFSHVVVKGDHVEFMYDGDAFKLFNDAVARNKQIAAQVKFVTPDPYINTLGGALMMAADGDWDGQTWLHGCVGWRMPLAGWRAAYAGDVLGWNDRAVSHFNAYAKSQVTDVAPTIPHPSQDAAMNMARAEKRWGTQMYSNGYICRNPERNDQMHHYDMNLNYIDELLWHFQYDADTAYMRQMWPVIKSHLAWEKRNYDPDGDHLYDAYCCIWASDALYYSGGAVTHSSAYNYRANLLAARIAQIIGDDGQPYADEAVAILKAMDERLWLPEQGHWAEYEDAMGLKRKHASAAVWSIYTPIDCGACTPDQARKATEYIDRELPHIDVESTGLQTISTSNWMPYSWSINNVATAEVMHTALAYFEAGRAREGYQLLRANVLDNMYYGQSPANFGQLSHYDAARGECYRDFGDCIGIASRTLLQGLFGIIPNALYGECIIRPGLPAHWPMAQVTTPYLTYKMTRKNGKDRFEVTQKFTRPLRIVFRHNQPDGSVTEIQGTTARTQVFEVPSPQNTEYVLERIITEGSGGDTDYLGLSDPIPSRGMKQVNIDQYMNAEVDDIFKQRYESPRPQTTTLQIPIQGVGEWCHPQYTPVVNDSLFRTLAKDNTFSVADIPFRTPQAGPNIVYTSLWDNYPDAVTIPLKGRASAAYLLMAGSTNHMQSRIDNGEVVVTYRDGSVSVLPLRNPDNWCPIEQDYFIDGQAFSAPTPRPYRVSLGTGTVSRDLGQALGIKGVYGREIPGGAAQMLRMRLEPQKKLKSITVRTLSNDVVIGLMGITLQ
ncbi:MAG: DUF4450 domain-containing protein [Prevotella sp.]|nr:DUF4450 domain-containing protein [Prevotella sp.]